MSIAAGIGRIPALRVRDATTFSVVLLLGTILPPTFMIIANAVFDTPPAFFQPGLTALAFLGGGHVFITFWFYLDSRARTVMDGERRYYYAIPLMVMGTAALVYTFVGPELRPYAYAAFGLSAQWHHARQNIGVYTFLSKAWGLGRVSAIERTVLSLSFLGSVFVGIRWYGLPLATPEVSAILYNIGVACFAVIFLAAVFYGLREYAAHRNARKTLLFVSLSLFFVPAVLFTSPGAAASFGAAHAVQYYLFLYYVIYRSPEKVLTTIRLPSSRIGWLAAIALAAVWPLVVLYGLSQVYMSFVAMFPNHLAGGLDTLIFGLVMGWVITHYVIDAGIWKMGDAKVREYHKDTFAFLR